MLKLLPESPRSLPNNNAKMLVVILVYIWLKIYFCQSRIVNFEVQYFMYNKDSVPYLISLNQIKL